MRKLYLSLVILFCSQLTFAQDGSDSPSQFLHAVPNSPNASSLGKYGDIPVNLCTGRINYKVPLLQINESDFLIPIELNYNYSGLIVDEDPGITGYGWNISTNYSITRVIKGRPDDGVFGYLQYLIGKDYVEPYIKNTLPFQNLCDLSFWSAIGRKDSEPDLFIINTPAFSASFVFNTDKKPIFFKGENYKIEIIGNTFILGFRLTDDKGNLFVFDNKETTTIEPGFDGEMSTFYSTWCLTSIKPQKSISTINFIYENYDYNKITYSEFQKTAELATLNGNCSLDGNGSIPSGGHFLSFTNSNIEAKILKEIQFSSGIINFENDLNHNLLRKISLKDLNSNLIDSFDFNYYTSNNTIGKFITSITKRNNSTNFNEPYYSFDYYSPFVVTIDYRKQDYWGYYNGQIHSSTELLSATRAPNFDFSLTGALKKIVYPTKGFTSIEYEPIVISGTINNVDLPGTMQFSNVNQFSLNAHINNGNDIELNEQLYIEGKAKVEVSCSAAGLNYRQESEASFVHQNIFNQSLDSNCYLVPPNGLVNISGSDYNEGNGVLSEPPFSKSCYFNFGAATANIRLRVFRSNNLGGAAMAKVVVSSNPNYLIGGIRVSKTIDDDLMNNQIIKNYKYIDVSGLSSGILLSKPLFTNYSFWYGQNGNSLCSLRYINNFTQSMVPLMSFQGSPVLYNRVETIINDGSNGKIVEYYNGNKNFSVTTTGIYQSNKDWRKGNLLKKEIYSKKAGVFVLDHVIENSYDILKPYNLNQAINLNEVGLSFKAKFKNDAIPNTVLIPVENCNQSNLNHNCYIEDQIYEPEYYILAKSKEKSITTTGILETETIYDFNISNGYLFKKTANNSSGESLETKYFYPQDSEMSEEPFAQDLIIKNIVGTPLDTQVFKNSVKLSEQKTEYAIEATTNNLILPKYIYSNKGTSTISADDKKITFDSYDTKGNITQYTMENSIPVSIIWGYNKTQPIAKIENASYASISSGLIIAAQGASDTGTESSLLTALTALRIALPEAMVTTYTYKPLIGVSTITDPKGDKQTFTYDSFGRLESVKDNDGMTLSANEYHYRTQN